MAVVVRPDGSPVPGALVHRHGMDWEYSETDYRGRVVLNIREDSEVYTVDGRHATVGPHTTQHKRLGADDELAVFVVQELRPELSQPTELGQASNAALPGVVLDYVAEGVTLGEGEGIYFDEGHPLTAPFDPPEGMGLIYLLWFGPQGTEFEEPASLTIPNRFGAQPLEEVTLFGFNDTSLDWEAVAILQVSEDGEQLVTTAGGIGHFSAFGFFGERFEYTVTGTVKDVLGRPQSGISVQVVGSGGVAKKGITNSQGRYTALSVTAVPPPWGRVMAWASYSGTLHDNSVNWVEGPTTADPSFPVEMPDLLLPAVIETGSIRGHAWDEMGLDVAGALVEVPAVVGPSMSILTDARGRFSISGVPAGMANVTFLHRSRWIGATVEGIVPERGEWNLGDVVLEPLPDITPPRLSFTFPVNGQIEVPPPGAIRLMYDEALDANSLSGILMRGLAEEVIPGTFRLEEDGRLILYTPNEGFLEGLRYSFRLEGTLADVAGNAVGADVLLSFRTRTPACPGGQCFWGRFDWTQEQCIEGYRPDGATCNLGLFCTEDHCMSHVCVPRDIATGCLIEGACYAEGAALGAVGNDSCHACLGGISKTTWSPTTGGPCDDGNPCTRNSLCNEGVCAPGQSMNCDDGNPCTDDICDFAVGCSNIPGEGSCDDGDPCTVGDSCQVIDDVATCLPGTEELECGDDGNQCTVSVCVPMEGCATQNLNGEPCDDGNPCTLGDVCVLSTCLPGPDRLDCDDENSCTTDRCDPILGCINEECGGGNNSRGVCVGGQCTYECLEDYWDLDENGAHDCEYHCVYQGEEDVPGDGVDSNCDGSDVNISATLFVANVRVGGNDYNPGTMISPMATIQAALLRAQANPEKRWIVVSSGIYTGPVELVDGVSIYGGYCRITETGEWEFNPEAHFFEINVPASSTNNVVVFGKNIFEPTTLAYGRIVLDKGGAQGSNYGFHLENIPGLTLESLQIFVARPGEPPTGTNGTTPPTAAAGKKGGDGYSLTQQKECNMALPAAGAGGTAATCSPSGQSSSGGSGGGVRRNGNGYAGAAGASSGGGGGSAGTESANPGNGGIGANGAAGTDAPGGANFGTIVNGFYAPAVTPNTSTHGAGGKGGGGGGGAWSKTDTTDHQTWSCYAGAAGSGGGAGGCGGRRGTSGNGGFGVFGVLVIGAPPTILDCTIRVSPGSHGGPGGKGSNGASGGAGATGNAGDGGKGGNGGRGGHGGGGGGGPSFCLWTANPQTPPQISGLTCSGYVAGKGGTSSGNKGADGQAGIKNW